MKIITKTRCFKNPYIYIIRTLQVIWMRDVRIHARVVGNWLLQQFQIIEKMFKEVIKGMIYRKCAKTFCSLKIEHCTRTWDNVLETMWINSEIQGRKYLLRGGFIPLHSSIAKWNLFVMLFVANDYHGWVPCETVFYQLHLDYLVKCIGKCLDISLYK